MGGFCIIEVAQQVAARIRIALHLAVAPRRRAIAQGQLDLGIAADHDGPVADDVHAQVGLGALHDHERAASPLRAVELDDVDPELDRLGGFPFRGLGHGSARKLAEKP